MAAFGLHLCINMAFVTMVTAGPRSAPLNLTPLMSTYLGGGTSNTTNNITSVAVDKPDICTSQVPDLTIMDFWISEERGVAGIHVRDSGPTRHLLIQGDFGISVYRGSFDNFAWEQDLGLNCSDKNCESDISNNGYVAVLDLGGKILHSYDNTGNKLGTIDNGTKSGHHPQDVAIDPVNKRILLAKFYQSYTNHVPVQVPCLVAYTYDLKTQSYVDYCIDGNDDYETHNIADSRAQNLYYNDIDQKLYLSGYTDGGNSIFRYNPVDIRNNNQSSKGLSVMDEEHKPHYDQYTDTYNMHGARSINFVSRIDPKDGRVEKAQFFLARLSNGDGNSISGRDIAAGANGQVFVAQSAVSSIDNRDTIKINGEPVGPYGGGDAVLLGLPETFGYRQIWHHFQKTSGHNDAMAVAATSFNGKSLVAFLARTAESEYITVHPLPNTG